MRKREQIFFAFFLFLFLSFGVFALSNWAHVTWASVILEKALSPLQSISFSMFQKLPFISESSQMRELKDANLALVSKVSDYEQLKEENTILHEQFQIGKLKNTIVLPAKIIGAPNFIPNVTIPSIFILNKGESDGIRKGQAVMVKDNLVGKVIETTHTISKMESVTSNSSFAAKTIHGALGVAKSKGKGIEFSNILLSENIKVGDIVVTKGDITIKGIGNPPELVVGKIVSIDKNPSNLFQKAKVESLVDFNKLSTVFVVTGIE